MAVTITKPQINVREKLKELDFETVPFQKMPSGSVIQVVGNTFNNLNTVQTNLQTYQSTGVEIDITPHFSNSFIVVNAMANVEVENLNGIRVSISRNGTSLLEGGFGSQRVYVHDGDTHNIATLIAVDRPQTTLNLNYEFVFKSDSGNSVKFRGSVGGQTITAMEIAQ